MLGAMDRTGTLWRFVLLLGLVSLLADVTYEGARGVIGPYLALLGAGAGAVGLSAGLGEGLGYALRLLTGPLADRWRAHWVFVAGGYLLTFVAVPLLALAGGWPLATALFVAERMGKGLRSPSRDALLSLSASPRRRGLAFGVHEALDQVGAVAGPLAVAGGLTLGWGYRGAFLLLALPGALALPLLALARRSAPPVPPPRSGAGGGPVAPPAYLAFTALTALGFPLFPFLAFRLVDIRLVPEPAVPALFALAMGLDALSAPVLGALLDRWGGRALALVPLLGILAVPLALAPSRWGVGVGLALWGLALGGHESALRAGLARRVPPDRRGTAYGLFHAVYGACALGAGLWMGFLYPVLGPAGVALGAVAIQALALVPLALEVRGRP